MTILRKAAKLIPLTTFVVAFQGVVVFGKVGNLPIEGRLPTHCQIVRR